MTFVPIASAVRGVIVGNAAVIAAGFHQRVFPKVLPQNTTIPPVAVTYEVLADIPFDTIGGMAGLYRAVLEYKVWSKKTTEAAETAEILRLAIQAYQGNSLGVNILGVHHLHDQDDFEAETGEYNLLVRFGVFYGRENPNRS